MAQLATPCSKSFSKLGSDTRIYLITLNKPNSKAAQGIVRPIYGGIRNAIVGVVGTREDFGIDYDKPAGDPGLFGPDTATWKMHADFPAMMSGGVCALMLQTLHPRALAGVLDHSNFREDALGRLQRTTMFVGATTYAPLAHAERIIKRVDGLHARVKGKTRDGRAYSAREPELLTWVHCTEMYSFMRGYLTYRKPDLPVAWQDRYFDETRRIAEALGAMDVPDSRAAMDDYFQSMLPELEFSERSRDTLAVLESMHLPIPAAGFSRRVFLGAGAALLPEWAQGLIRRNRRQRAADWAASQSLRGVAPLIRGALAEGIAMRSARRMGRGRECLEFSG